MVHTIIIPGQTLRESTMRQHSKMKPNIFLMAVAEKITSHIGIDYLAYIDLKKYSITMEPIENHINCKNNGKILGYRDLVKMDAPVWTNSMCNELGHLS